MTTTTFAAKNAKNIAPRLSIIIASRNAARTLGRCLESIEGQSFINWEVLIADGSSNDGTVELIREHERHIAWWTSERDGGIYDAWNRALAHARGEYVCFLGADDEWADCDAVGRLVATAGTQEYDLVSSQGLVFDPVTRREMRFGSEWSYRRIGRHMVVCHPGLLHRRSLFERYGFFNTHYRIAGDLDFLLRLPAETRAIHLGLVSVRIEAAGISRKNVLTRLREQREILARCSRYGTCRAYLCWLDKLWRYPIARLLSISH